MAKTWLEREASKRVALKEAILDQFPDLDPDDEYLRDTLNGENEFEELAGRLIDYHLRLLKEAEAADNMVAIYTDMAKSKRDRADKIKRRLVRALEAQSESSLPTPLGTLSLRTNGRPPLYYPQGEDAVPAEYKVQPPAPKPKPDKEALRAALKDPEKRRALAPFVVIGNAEPIATITRK